MPYYRYEQTMFDSKIEGIDPYPCWKLLKGHFNTYQQAMEAIPADMIVISSPVLPAYTGGDTLPRLLGYECGFMFSQVATDSERRRYRTG